MQPVYVDDLAAGIVAAINEPRTENEDYNLAGPEGVPFHQIIHTIAKLLGRRVRLVSISGREAALIARWARHLPGFPVTEEQVLRLLEDKAFDISKPRKDLRYDPRPFSEGIASEIASMRSAGVLR
jgi:NADH dehydrogenase